MKKELLVLYLLLVKEERWDQQVYLENKDHLEQLEMLENVVIPVVRVHLVHLVPLDYVVKQVQLDQPDHLD